MRARRLHAYRSMGYEILGTQQMDLHLTTARKFSRKLLLKPLPYWIFSHEFWSKHICREALLWESAAGLLLSYTWLITTPLDLQVAQDLTLLPKTITWRQWKLLVSSFGDNVDMSTLQQVGTSYSAYRPRCSQVAPSGEQTISIWRTTYRSSQSYLPHQILQNPLSVRLLVRLPPLYSFPREKICLGFDPVWCFLDSDPVGNAGWYQFTCFEKQSNVFGLLEWICHIFDDERARCSVFSNRLPGFLNRHGSRDCCLSRNT